MNFDKLIQLPSGRTYIGEKAIGRLGEEAGRLGRFIFIQDIAAR